VKIATQLTATFQALQAGVAAACACPLCFCMCTALSGSGGPSV